MNPFRFFRKYDNLSDEERKRQAAEAVRQAEQSLASRKSLEQLQAELKAAEKVEDYERCARLRDAINSKKDA